MDRISSAQRSANMAKVRSKDTHPELVVRRLAHRLGLRFRLHRRDLPGTPDLVFPKHRLAVFVHGCFWHRHAGCSRASAPATRREFWEAKFAATLKRDIAQSAALEKAGWRVMTVWECELRRREEIAARLADECSIQDGAKRAYRPEAASKRP